MAYDKVVDSAKLDAAMSATADAIRGKTGSVDSIVWDESTGFANAVGGVYEAGEKYEYDRFWDDIQNNGDESGANYYYAFSYNRMSDDVFNPKYDLICASGTSPARAIFYSNERITDTKKSIRILGNNAQSMFYSCKNLVTIRGFITNRSVEYQSTFGACGKLVTINVSGEIGKSIDFKPCILLSHDSIVSIINALASDVTGQTVSFSAEAVNNAFTDAEWSALIATKTNWTISLA